MATTGEIRVGIAGWVYEPWRGSFYPKGLPQKQELAHASTMLRTLEINATFYANQKLASFANWHQQVRPGFVFAVKGPKFITHQKKLRDVAAPLANFMASGVLKLGDKLGPFIWQLPGNLGFDAERIETFLALLPQTPDEAAELAARQDGRIAEPYAGIEGVSRIRHAMEVRDASYATPEFIALLRRYNVAMVIADTADWPYRDLTADFAYLRLQGPVDTEATAYSPGQIDAWARQFRDWSLGTGATTGPTLGAATADTSPRDVFAFFVHENKENAPVNARAVMATLDLKGAGE